MGTRERPRRRGGRPRFGGNGRRPERRSPVPELTELTPFSVFCAFHLGITETDGYSRQDEAAVSRRFGLSPGDLRDYLCEHRLRSEDLAAADFNLSSAQLDIQVAPEGISRTELARTVFAELQASLGNGEVTPEVAEIPTH
jgi:hypothetical protein